MITMAEIDRLRAEADLAIEIRRITGGSDDDPVVVAHRPSRVTTVREAEGRVLAALREWWAQGCREIAPPKAVEPKRRGLRCRFGYHDWRRRERTKQILPPGNPLSFAYTMQFEQCRRCDKTRDGWAYNAKLDAPPPPEPLPWDEPNIQPERPWPRS